MTRPALSSRRSQQSIDASVEPSVRQKGQPELPSLVPRTVARSAGYEGFLSAAINACRSCE